MSHQGGRLGEVIAYESLNHTGSKIGLIKHMVTAGVGVLQGFNHVKSQFQENYPCLLIETFQSIVLPRNAIMLQHLIIQFPLYDLSSGRLREVKVIPQYCIAHPYCARFSHH